jgi:hypothetical protein
MDEKFKSGDGIGETATTLVATSVPVRPIAAALDTVIGAGPRALRFRRGRPPGGGVVALATRVGMGVDVNVDVDVGDEAAEAEEEMELGESADCTLESMLPMSEERDNCDDVERAEDDTCPLCWGCRRDLSDGGGGAKCMRDGWSSRSLLSTLLDG